MKATGTMCSDGCKAFGTANYLLCVWVIIRLLMTITVRILGGLRSGLAVWNMATLAEASL